MEDIIKTKDLHRYFYSGPVTVHAIKNITVAIRKGGFTILCGPSGSGKRNISLI